MMEQMFFDEKSKTGIKARKRGKMARCNQCKRRFLPKMGQATCDSCLHGPKGGSEWRRYVGLRGKLEQIDRNTATLEEQILAIEKQNTNFFPRYQQKRFGKIKNPAPLVRTLMDHVLLNRIDRCIACSGERDCDGCPHDPTPFFRMEKECRKGCEIENATPRPLFEDDHGFRLLEQPRLLQEGSVVRAPDSADYEVTHIGVPEGVQVTVSDDKTVVRVTNTTDKPAHACIRLLPRDANQDPYPMEKAWVPGKPKVIKELPTEVPIVKNGIEYPKADMKLYSDRVDKMVKGGEGVETGPSWDMPTGIVSASMGGTDKTVFPGKRCPDCGRALSLQGDCGPCYTDRAKILDMCKDQERFLKKKGPKGSIRIPWTPTAIPPYVEGTCKYCGIPLPEDASKMTKYCKPEHRDAYRAETADFKSISFAQFKSMVLRRVGVKCERCEGTENLGITPKVAVKDGGKEFDYENYSVICVKCGGAI